ncbi:ribbon-helix-helix domain-containing protein [Deinococcus caeni]|uniref:ribbon-helix-helix domain-containing protein n=1 Tax=Deinococcus caeni TaxID=569127 RepID=UPI0031E9DA72
MTQKQPRRIHRENTGAQEVVTFRLPGNLLQKLDEQVIREGSSRTDIIRGALAIYHSLDQQALVPVSTKTRQLLSDLAESQNRPASAIAGELLEGAVQREAVQAVEVMHFSMVMTRAQTQKRWGAS